MNKVFKRSSIDEINKHIGDSKGTKWLLCMDAHRFHVYVAAITLEGMRVRIDWNKESTLTFEKYKPRPGEEAYEIGTNDFFCKRCIEDAIRDRLHQYDLFKFNCRTVSFMILALAGFDSHHVYDEFRKRRVLCGLVESECLKIDELRHFFEYEVVEEGCIIL